MPSIIRTYDPKYGPLINTRIVPRGKVDWAEAGAVGSLSHTYEFLLDTGASCTYISPRIAQELDLEPQGRKNMITSAGKNSTKFYVVELGLLFDEGKMHWECNHEVLSFIGDAQGYDGLIGRDILCRGVFTMSKDKYFSFNL